MWAGHAVRWSLRAMASLTFEGLQSCQALAEPGRSGINRRSGHWEQPIFPSAGVQEALSVASSAVWMSHILSEGVLTVWFSQDSFYMFLYVFMKIVALRLTLNEPKSSPVRTTGRMGVARLACTTTCCAKGWDTMGQRDTKRLQRDQKATIALNCSGRPRRPQTTTQDLEWCGTLFNFPAPLPLLPPWSPCQITRVG